ncbi:helicase [Streptomyces antibioticus]|uniref:Helicase n=1 Tax=Streptomyces antibioticus TaxID=1890 RepID=A0A1S9NHS4_STRAT|nr:helicase [Streptomyces antibioticus]OOQ48271.1 helicase [Streptomyces antibioticus]OOQ54530.1 helicase [Streptomyces antibioticus]QIT42131.1 helicase [Streptomyces antibioticus]QIT48636.1 helicase [Streptomyces antibioticus]
MEGEATLVSELGVWVSNVEARQDKRMVVQRAALVELGVDWA